MPLAEAIKATLGGSAYLEVVPTWNAPPVPTYGPLGGLYGADGATYGNLGGDLQPHPFFIGIGTLPDELVDPDATLEAANAHKPAGAAYFFYDAGSLLEQWRGAAGTSAHGHRALTGQLARSSGIVDGVVDPTVVARLNGDREVVTPEGAGASRASYSWWLLPTIPYASAGAIRFWDPAPGGAAPTRLGGGAVLLAKRATPTLTPLDIAVDCAHFSILADGILARLYQTSTFPTPVVNSYTAYPGGPIDDGAAHAWALVYDPDTPDIVSLTCGGLTKTINNALVSDLVGPTLLVEQLYSTTDLRSANGPVAVVPFQP